MRKIKIAAVFGTRPEAIKMAPVVLEMRKYPDYIEPYVIVTAQHRDMLDQVLDLFSIKPDFDLDIMTPGQTLFAITERALKGLEKVLSEISPDIVLVHGDTTTTFVAALASYYKQIPVGHVEAGLRTGDKYSPFPEEANRQLTGVLADLHFAPTNTARQNLLKENVSEEKIFVTGNTVIDALKLAVTDGYNFNAPVLSECVNNGKKLIVVTTHRRENWGEPLQRIYSAITRVLQKHTDVEVIFPVHKNPQIQRAARESLGNIPRVHLIDPLDYGPFVNLMAKAHIILSDSGGVQEEAPALGKPVLVLRDTTERPEAVLAGTVQLVGTDEDKLFVYTSKLIEDEKFYKKMAGAVNPYGDGFAALRIIQTILYQKGVLDTKPVYFRSDY